MKSKTSFFDLTVLKKDIIRFAPLWAIYLIGGLLVILTVMSGRDSGYEARSLAQTTGPFSVINLIYAILCAMMLFGDLFNPRMCNALHAMPLRREGWFFSHLAAGLLFSIVPHSIAVLLLAPSLQEFWVVALCWWLGMTMEYLFFFGVAVFSVFCTGNRFASVAVYGLLNFGSLIIGWFITTIYEPLMYGLILRNEIFTFFSPVCNIAANEELLLVEKVNGDIRFMGFSQDGMWTYIAICTAIGIGLMALALLLYRRRRLECAGDFIAVKPLGPIFSVIFTLTAGCIFALFSSLFGIGVDVLFLTVGMIIGWFGAQMLLQRTVKVFKLRTFGALGLLWAVMLLSIGLTTIDPLGITRYVPGEGQIAKVEMDTGMFNQYSRDYFESDSQEDIYRIRDIHQDLINDRNASYDGNRRTIYIRYTLTSGVQIDRMYMVYYGSPAWNKLRVIYDTPESVLGYTDWNTWVDSIFDIYVEGDVLSRLCMMYEDKYGIKMDYAKISRELLLAMKADCETGHFGGTFSADEYQYSGKYYIELEFKSDNERYTYRSYSVLNSASNTLAWFEKYKELIAIG